MEGCRRGRADRELLHAPRGDRSHFRPLAGLSCINLLSNRTYDGRTYNDVRRFVVPSASAPAAAAKYGAL